MKALLALMLFVLATTSTAHGSWSIWGTRANPCDKATFVEDACEKQLEREYLHFGKCAFKTANVSGGRCESTISCDQKGYDVLEIDANCSASDCAKGVVWCMFGNDPSKKAAASSTSERQPGSTRQGGSLPQ